MEPIKIHLGEENHIYIEEDIMHSQLFVEQYEQLHRKIAEYIGRVENDAEATEYSSRNDNNIFLINGERGAGKTSMLVSMHSHMQKKDNVFGRKFLCLHVIDPSSFTNNANILQIIIAELFKAFKDATKDKTIGYETKNEITSIFVQIKHALCVLESPTLASKMDDSDIESLSDMSNAMDLEYLIIRLVTKMLLMLGKDKLLVFIDDLDVNTTHAYDMLEQIRKYLILPKVVILIAAKTKQLLEVVQQHYLNEFKSLLEKEMMTSRDIIEISTKYLLKLFPLEHRVDLNNAEGIFYQPIEVWDGEKKITSASNGDELIYKLIYQKTGLQYLLEQEGTNYIVPTNLRAFRFLVKLLCDMDQDKKLSNIDIYQHYFISEWLPENLHTDEQKNIQTLFTYSDLSKINKRIIHYITNGLNSIELPPQISILTDEANVYSNVSLGDLMAVILWAKSVNSSEPFARYIYAVKHAYTILFEKAFREMLQEESIQKKVNIYNAKDASMYLNSYQRLVNGALLNGYTWDYLLPASEITDNRLHRVISLNNTAVPVLSNMVGALVLTSNRTKMVNEGEAYRKQVPTYYQQSIAKGTNQVIIDWFNILYSIPFWLEHFSRFGDSVKDSIINTMRETSQKDDVAIHRDLFGYSIHSVDLLERIYWHVREKRNYLRTETDKLKIYYKFLQTVQEVPVDDYIDDVDDRLCLETIVKLAKILLEQEQDVTFKILEEIQARVLPPIGYPELSTIRKYNTAEQLKGRMRYINTAKGYDPMWLDSQFDSLGITDEEVQNQDPRTIRNRLKRIKA